MLNLGIDLHHRAQTAVGHIEPTHIRDDEDIARRNET
jgi:hypothetical protein